MFVWMHFFCIWLSFHIAFHMAGSAKPEPVHSLLLWNCSDWIITSHFKCWSVTRFSPLVLAHAGGQHRAVIPWQHCSDTSHMQSPFSWGPCPSGCSSNNQSVQIKWVGCWTRSVGSSELPDGSNLSFFLEDGRSYQVQPVSVGTGVHTAVSSTDAFVILKFSDILS